MKANRFIILLLLSTLLAGTAVAGTDPISRHYAPPPLSSSRPGYTIVVSGTVGQITTFCIWLNQIAAVPKGLDTLETIADSGHRLEIQHSTHSLISAGRTVAPMSSNLINGQGESVRILFNAHIPHQGSHMVFDGRRQLIEYTAIQNLYHELAHAMHMMNGTWRYFKSERQAIEEENEFRRDLALMQGKTPVYRFRKSGVLINDVDNTIVMSEWFGPSIMKSYKRRVASSNIVSTGIVP